jgi:hypothetical protein
MPPAHAIRYVADDMSRSMERILTDTVLRNTLVARALARVKRCSWREAAEARRAVGTSFGAA